MSAGTPRPAAVWPLRWPGRRRSALSESLWQRAAAEGAVAAVGTPPRAFSLALYPPGGVSTRLAERDAGFNCCGLVICILLLFFHHSPATDCGYRLSKATLHPCVTSATCTSASAVWRA